MSPSGPLVTARHFLKKLAFALLPPRVQEEIDFQFYLRRLRAGSQVHETEFEILHRFVRPGTVALDVGANLGGYAMALSDLVGTAGDVHAFEPVPRTFRLLDRSMAALGKRVRMHRAAASASVGETTFYVPLEGSLENFYVASLLRPAVRSVELRITTTTLDQWRREYPDKPVSFVKIDAEGAEYDVLRGAGALLQREQPVVLCEISHETPPPEKDVFALMRAAGYTSFQHVGGRLVAREAGRGRVGPNFVFIPRSQLSAFSDLIATAPA